MDVGRRNYQEGEFGNVRQRVNFVTAADAQRAPAEEKKWNVGAERSGNFHKASVGNFASGQPQASAQRRSGIARPAAEAAAGWNVFVEIDLDAPSNLEFATQGIDGFINEVLACGFQRKGLVSVNVQADASSLGIAEPQFIMERNGLKDGAEFVVRIGALAEDVQAQVNFSERWDSDFAHAAIAA